MGASLVAQLVKNLPAMQETLVHFLGWEDPLEKEMATHFSILAWRIPWTEEPDRLQSTGSRELDTTATKPPLVLLGKQRADKLSHRGTQQTSFCTMCASSPLAKETHTRVNRQVDILPLS